tara:strand:- start:123 stop:368 length:246 start_codon:yes stop_codon:yes gene_type:complete
MDAIEFEVRRVVAEKLNLPSGGILDLNDRLTNDLDMDSLDALEIAMELEVSFDTSIADDVWEGAVTAKCLIEIIKKDKEGK